MTHFHFAIFHFRLVEKPRAAESHSPPHFFIVEHFVAMRERFATLFFHPFVVRLVVFFFQSIFWTFASHAATVAFPTGIVVATEIAVATEFFALVFPLARAIFLAVVPSVFLVFAIGTCRCFFFLEIFVANGASLLSKFGKRAVENHIFAKFAFQSAVEHGNPNRRAQPEFVEMLRFVADNPSMVALEHLFQPFAKLDMANQGDRVQNAQKASRRGNVNEKLGVRRLALLRFFLLFAR